MSAAQQNGIAVWAPKPERVRVVVDGTVHEMTRDGEWWRADAELAAVRDYFRIEDDSGERLWIYRAGDGEHQETGSHRWFLHGIFG